MQQTLADSEAFSTQEIETYQVALEELNRHIALLELSDKLG